MNPYTRRDTVKARIIDTFSAARILGSTDIVLNERLRTIYASRDWRLLRVVDRAYLSGYLAALHDELWHSLRMQQYSAVDGEWHDTFGVNAPTTAEWSRLYSAQCRPSENGHIDYADTNAYGISRYYASNSGMPTRYLWPDRADIRVYLGDSVVLRDWRPS